MPGEIDPAELPTENLLWLPETGKWYSVCPLDFIQKLLSLENQVLKADYAEMDFEGLLNSLQS